jgi:hypothetical protein
MTHSVSGSSTFLDQVKQETAEMAKIKLSLYELFQSALSGSDCESEFYKEIQKISTFSKAAENNKIKLFTQGFIFCIHLSKWEVINELLSDPLCLKMHPANITAALWTAAFETRADVLSKIQKSCPDFLRDRDKRCIFLAKKGLLERMDYHLHAKDEE